MKILVVDDSATMRNIIGNILEQIGYTDILNATDGAEALEILKNNEVDLVITDWNMSVMSGLELVKCIRADETMDGMPIIMVTSESAKSEIITALQAGVNHYIIKPFTREMLSEKIAALFS